MDVSLGGSRNRRAMPDNFAAERVHSIENVYDVFVNQRKQIHPCCPTDSKGANLKKFFNG